MRELCIKSSLITFRRKISLIGCPLRAKILMRRRRMSKTEAAPESSRRSIRTAMPAKRIPARTWITITHIVGYDVTGRIGGKATERTRPIEEQLLIDTMALMAPEASHAIDPMRDTAAMPTPAVARVNRSSCDLLMRLSL